MNQYWVSCIIQDENDNWSFHYENGTYLTDEERTELENWFITCG